MDRLTYVKWLLDEKTRLDDIFKEQSVNRVSDGYSSVDLREDFKKRVKAQLDKLEEEEFGGAQ